MATLGLKGYDPVSYFQMLKTQPVKGSHVFQSDYQGYTYHFANESNKQIFDTSPSAYAPAYGGHCATAMSEGKKIPANPKNYMIYNGVLYVFFSMSVFVNTYPQWNKNRDGRIEAADKQRSILNK